MPGSRSLRRQPFTLTSRSFALALFNLDETQLVNTVHAKNNAKHAAAWKAADGDSEEEGQ
jgi:hypothetical protein